MPAPGWRPEISMGYGDLYRWMQGWRTLEPANDSNCFSFPLLDGAKEWLLGSIQCHMNSTCMAMFRSFHFHPRIVADVAQLRSKMKRFLAHGDSYSCLHINSAIWWPTFQAYTAIRCPILLEPGMDFRRGAHEINRTQLHRNVLLVSQEDQVLKKLLLEHLHTSYGWTSDDISFFTLSDLGAAETSRMGWDSDNYIWRAAVSVGLCQPGMADTYIGEFYSGFTQILTVRALIDGPFKNNWLMQIYGHISKPGGPAGSYPRVVQQKIVKPPPPWIHILGFNDKYEFDPCWNCTGQICLNRGSGALECAHECVPPMKSCPKPCKSIDTLA
eukprot:gnl/TRDRNA2_/TRDRNA2_160546_c0_seq2.p1 gnl/TRDRNA2_/TRDRNA2_160546_c0~~gnl/TRDRNA2_/TRDRNA2_160546_c0_seq2.p1  ORF type:complete len:372 (+),score=21.99 gnl/TRDRNA2_/TRDRNA2_160546_c0_seq2:133-1116(+)